MRNRTSNQPVILFDGVCNLCNNWVQFVIKRDSNALFKFASLQSDAAKSIMESHNVQSQQLDSIILIDGTKVYTESSAVLHILSKLKGPIKTLAIFRIIPKGLRDKVYRFVAKNRYKWFGQQDACMIPTPDLKKRFIEDKKDEENRGE